MGQRPQSTSFPVSLIQGIIDVISSHFIISFAQGPLGHQAHEEARGRHGGGRKVSACDSFCKNGARGKKRKESDRRMVQHKYLVWALFLLVRDVSPMRPLLPPPLSLRRK